MTKYLFSEAVKSLLLLVQSSGEEEAGKEEESPTSKPTMKGITRQQLQVVLRCFPMEGLKVPSVTSGDCEKMSGTDPEFKALYEALKRRNLRKCENQGCKGSEGKCQFCRNPAILARKTMFAALRSHLYQLRKNQESGPANGPAKAADEEKNEDEDEREEPEEKEEDDE